MMVTLRRELTKIFRQLKGTQNIFDYESAVAGQLYLLYCFGGHIYFSEKIHKHVKYLWFVLIACQVIFVCAMNASYLWYGSKNDLMMIFYVLNATGSVNMATVGFPLILYAYGDRIEKMIQRVDDILSSSADPAGLKQNKVMADMKKYFGWFFMSFMMCWLVYVAVGVLDLVLFFEEHKAKNYLYYAWPPPLVQKYADDLGTFFVGLALTSLMFLLFIFELWSVIGLELYYGVICFNELASIRDYLRFKTCDLDKWIEKEGKISDRWCAIFEYALQLSSEEFRKTTRLIDYLRGFVEVICTFVIIFAFWYGVAMLYVCTASDLPSVLKIKCAMGYLLTGITVFLFYWIGQSLNNWTSEVSTAVYFTPWYRSVKVRRNVYVFLCQSQSVKSFAVFKVYGLLMYNFSRYLHCLVSYTNMLLKLTRK